MRSLMAMLRPKGRDAGMLYGALVAEARRPAWYLDGAVADDIDGRFDVLSSLVGLTILRLEEGAEDAARHAVALTESFIADMDAQLREAGVGDPSVGKKVRMMVGSLAGKTDRWRQARSESLSWEEATAANLYRGAVANEAAATYATESFRRISEGLWGLADRAIMEGRIG